MFNKISADCSVDEYIHIGNSTATSEEADANKVDWHETLRQACIDEVVNSKEKTNDPDLGHRDDINESSLPGAEVFRKKFFYLFDEVPLIIVCNDGQRSLQKAVAYVISMVKNVSISSKKQSSITDFFKKK